MTSSNCTSERQQSIYDTFKGLKIDESLIKKVPNTYITPDGTYEWYQFPNYGYGSIITYMTVFFDRTDLVYDYWFLLMLHGYPFSCEKPKVDPSTCVGTDTCCMSNPLIDCYCIDPDNWNYPCSNGSIWYKNTDNGTNIPYPQEVFDRALATLPIEACTKPLCSFTIQ